MYSVIFARLFAQISRQMASLRRTIIVFLWDNLLAHHSAYVHKTVTNRAGPHRFSIVPRPQYHPKFGPIEYKICEVTLRIKLKKEGDMDDLEQQIMNIAMDIGPFETTFLHCGYQR